MSDLLIVKAKQGVNVKADTMNYWHEEILKQKETGVIVLPWFLEVVAVPEDIDAQILDPKSSCVLGDDQE